MKSRKIKTVDIRVDTKPVTSFNSIYNSLAGTGLLDS